MTNSLFSKSKSNKEEVNEQEQEECLDKILKKLNDENPNLKANLLLNEKYFIVLIIDLTWKKALELKNMYSIERRKQFTPRLVISEQQHVEKIVIQMCEDVKKYFNLPIICRYEEIIQQVRQKVLEEQCTKILFSKEEIKDYLNFFKNSKEIKRQLYNNKEMKDFYGNYQVEKQYIIDQAYEIFQLDECDELKAMKLFRDDLEVMQWWKEKENHLRK